ncbi:iron uptake porin [Alkalinema sp. FACHB-956]|uniref:iron uptake porin n=1 Tax=Alkalinema sp. FACHB-956 TaxID=2692768 RepID=UPI0016869DA4|nr:iron uptake porin [Alkalinema sp. FACHB-956]MBD2326551.1 iron uptake porin [Alkalinema sp. FACHB-956]
MLNIRLNSLLVSPAVLAAALLLGTSAAQAETKAPSVDALSQVSQYSQEGKSANSIGQVTSVSQLSDVKPTDWAFQALQSLVERYGCIAGYPDRTYRGNRAMTRYEFAAGLNACMDRVNELIAAATADLVKKEDLATLQKLQEEFAAELATLRGRVDALEAKTATLEKQQFSTTTKLAGEVIFAVTDEFSATPAGGGNNTVFQDRVRLSLNTSFTGKDLLVTRLAAGNAENFTLPGGGSEGLQTFNFGNTGANKVNVDWVAYYTSPIENLKVYIPAVGGLHYDYAPTANPVLDSGDSGSTTLSVFGQRNPIYAIGGGAGIGGTYDLGGGLKVTGGYLADSANNPANKNGLFNGDNSILAQVSYAPTDANFQVAATYVNAYRSGGGIFDAGGNSTAGAVGSLPANSPSVVATSKAAKVNAFGISAAYKFSPNLVFNAFGMYAQANFIDDGFGSQDIWSYGAGLALPDFGAKGNLLGFVVGAAPYAPGRQTGVATRAGRSIPLHVEGFYKYQINDNISITPGLIWVINPGQVDSNDDALIGTVRTTFTF